LSAQADTNRHEPTSVCRAMLNGVPHNNTLDM